MYILYICLYTSSLNSEIKFSDARSRMLFIKKFCVVRSSKQFHLKKIASHIIAKTKKVSHAMVCNFIAKLVLQANCRTQQNFVGKFEQNK